jgi:hypothetical protein
VQAAALFALDADTVARDQQQHTLRVRVRTCNTCINMRQQQPSPPPQPSQVT